MHLPCKIISIEVRHLKKYLRVILKMPNWAAVDCTNRSTKNPNLSFHEYVMRDCKILTGKNPFPRTTISTSSILKRLFRKRFKVKYDYGFSLCCNSSSSHLKTFFKDRFLVKILEKKPVKLLFFK